MRKHFADIINKKSKVDKSIFLITGDLGFGVLDKFRIENKGNFLNIGICEQTMLSFSAGMSQEFQNTFVYSISNFNTFRPSIHCHHLLANISLELDSIFIF